MCIYIYIPPEKKEENKRVSPVIYFALQKVKKAYYAKAADFHPDKLKSKDLPDEFTEFANSELAKINLAYETIKSSKMTRL